MLTNFVLKTIGSRVCSNLQQVRFKVRTSKWKSGYHGTPPLLEIGKFEELDEQQTLDQYAFTKIRPMNVDEAYSPLYDPFYEKFVTYIMKYSNKPKAYEIIEDSLERVKEIQLRKLKKQQARIAEAEAKGKPLKPEELEEIETNPLAILKKAIQNLKPVITTQKVKRGGATYQVPHPLTDPQSEYFAIKWIHTAVVDRPKPKKKLYYELMAQELIDASMNQGRVIKRRDDVHKLAEANRAYAHYRWG